MGYIFWLICWSALLFLLVAFVKYDIGWMSELRDIANWTGEERFGLVASVFGGWLILTYLYGCLRGY